MWTTSAQRHSRHASSTRDATYSFVVEIDFLTRFKVEESACACNSDALVQPVALLETLGDLPLHSLAHAFVFVLLPARQKQQSQQPTLLNSPRQPPSRCCCSSGPQQSNDRPHHSKSCPSASHAVTRATSPQHQITSTSALQAYMAPCHVPLPPSHAPAYQNNLLQALESAEACAQRLNVVILQLLQRVA